jgi:hypothetical protein
MHLPEVGNRAADIWNDLERQRRNDPLAEIRDSVAVDAECVLTEVRGCDLVNATNSMIFRSRALSV